jgi:SNF2 family DNA or RNA helicase
MAGSRALRPYQKEAFKFTGNIPTAGLFMDMRLGKTLVTVRRLIASDLFPVLVIAPYSALYGWKNEFVTEGIPAGDIRWLTESRKNRENEFVLPGAVYLMNKEGVINFQEVAFNKKWGAIVVDESTCLKNPTSQMSIFCTRWFTNVHNKFILTGTPAPEGALDLVQQLRFLDEKILGVKSYWEFRQKWCENTGYDYKLSPEGNIFIQERLRKFCFSLQRRDVDLDVRKIYMRRHVKLEPALRRSYDQLTKEFFTTMPDGTLLETLFASVKFGMLRRIAGGVVNARIVEEGYTVYMHKMDALVEILLDEIPGEQVVVYASYLNEIAFITGLLGAHDVPCMEIHGDVPPSDRQDIIEGFRRGDCRVLVCQPETVKYASDFSNCDTVIYFSTPLSGETRAQSEDRIVNVTKGGSVAYIDIIAENTVDEDCYDSLMLKEGKQDMLRRMLRRAQTEGVNV